MLKARGHQDPCLAPPKRDHAAGNKLCKLSLFLSPSRVFVPYQWSLPCCQPAPVTPHCCCCAHVLCSRTQSITSCCCCCACAPWSNSCSRCSVHSLVLCALHACCVVLGKQLFLLLLPSCLWCSHHSSPLSVLASTKSQASAPAVLGPAITLPADSGTTSWKPMITMSGPLAAPPAACGQRSHWCSHSCSLRPGGGFLPATL